ncbi:MAG: Ig-like domain-containing protein [Chloroflexota bacterium]
MQQAAVGRSSSRRRFAAAIAGLGLAGIAVLALARPDRTIATPPTVPVPLTSASFRGIDPSLGLQAGVTIEFGSAMDTRSVEANLTVEPAATVRTTWDPTGRVATVEPLTRWAAGTFYRLTVEAGALAENGRPLSRPVRTAFLTRPAAHGQVRVDLIRGRAPLEPTIELTYDRPVDVGTVAGGLQITAPGGGTPIGGSLAPAAASVGGLSAPDAARSFTLIPARRLDPNTRYRVVVSGVRDADGVLVDDAATSVTTSTAPSVVLFRPQPGSHGVGRDVAVSARFNEPMDRATSRAAFSVSAGGKPLAGRVSFAERGTVLVFVPAAPLPAGTLISIDVAPSARSAGGSQLAAPAHSTFTTLAPPARPPARSKSAAPSVALSSGGGSLGGGTWAAVERYYLRLMNCTRTGGWVTSSGRCSSPGGRNVAPLRLDAGISSRVSRPYARRLAVGSDCGHFVGSSPATRLRRAGYMNYTWAENIGCRSGNAYAAVLGSHLFFQSERSYNGGHYRNLMSTKYDRVGIGVWVASGRVRLVVDFYHP